MDEIGGSEVQLQLLAEFLKEKGHDVIYFVIEGRKDRPVFETYKNIKYFRNKNTKHRLKLLINCLSMLNNVINRKKPSLIYTRSLKYLFFITLISKIKRIPVIFHLPSSLNENDLSFLKNIKLIIKSRKHFLKYLSIKVFRYVDKMLCVSKDMERFLKNKVQISSATIYNMHSAPSPPFVKKNPPLIVWVNSIKEIKRPELFINLAKRCKDLNVKFILVGKISKNSFSKCISKKIYALSNLDYLGEIPYETVNELFAMVSINVLTSKSEGFNNSIIQACFRETPTVSLIDTDNILKNEMIGLHSSNFEHMVKQVIHLIKNEEERKEIGKRARQYALQHHNINKIGVKYLTLFKSILNKQ